MRIVLSANAAKYLRRLDNKTALRIKTAIRGLGDEPPRGDIKKLSGRHEEYRLRIGKYRVIFIVADSLVQVVAIGARGQIYNRLGE
jgi:mRNA interferase RelE/StbE